MVVGVDRNIYKVCLCLCVMSELKEVVLRPICKRCKSGMVNVRVDGSIICRRCGYDSKEDKE